MVNLLITKLLKLHFRGLVAPLHPDEKVYNKTTEAWLPPFYFNRGINVGFCLTI